MFQKNNERSVAEEKNAGKAWLETPLIEKQAWYPITIDWFLSWKLYVNFDCGEKDSRSDEEVESLKPSMIDNSKLVGVNKLLKPGLIEGQDFVLLPPLFGEYIFRKYKV